MPRITKRLPQDRAEYSFGDLVYWHLFKFGTRPSGNPGDKAGRVWELDAICSLLGITQRTLRNWIADKHLPDTVTPLSQELFGDNPAWDEARLELQTKLEEGWSAKRSGVRQGKSAPADVAGDAEPEASGREDGLSDQPQDERPASDEVFSAIQPRAPERLRPMDTPVSERRSWWQGRGLAAGLVAVVAVAGWQLSRKSQPPSPPPQTVAEVVPPKAVPPVVAVEQSAKTVAVDQAPTIPIPPAMTAPLDKAPPTHAEPAPALPTEDKRAEKRRVLTEKFFAARRAAQNREMRRQEDEARKRNADLKSAVTLQQQLEDDARALAAVGYRLRENTSVAGSSFRFLATSTITDCALACVKNNCDAFSWYRDQYPAGSPRRRVCYLFKRPFEIANYPGYAFGERISEPLVKSSLAPNADLGRPIRLAQAGPPKDVPAPADDVIRCAGGQVKVTGFKLTCDQTLGGGTTLGSAQLYYTVANINDCAAKCRPIAKCVGFTFNSGDPPGRHTCIIFGPTPEGRVSKGWVSGAR